MDLKNRPEFMSILIGDSSLIQLNNKKYGVYRDSENEFRIYLLKPLGKKKKSMDGI